MAAPARRRRAAGAPGRRWLYVLVVPWVIVCSAGFKNGPSYFVGLVLLFGGLALWAQRRQPRWLDSAPLRVADLLLFCSLVVLLAAEASLRAWIAWGDAPAWISAAPDPVRYRLDPSREYFGTRPNRAGFYDVEWEAEPAPGRRRVAVLGDSYTVGMLPYPENYVTLTEVALGPGVELLNLGVVHCAVREYIDILETEALSLAPDLVLVGVYIGNDIHKDTPSGLFSSEGSKVVQAARALWSLLHAGTPYLQAFSAQNMLREEPDGTRVEVPLMSEEEHLDREWKHLRQLFGPPADEDMRESWEDTERALADLVAACRSRGLPIVATIAPDEIQVAHGLLETVARANGAEPADFDLDYPNRRLAACLAALDVPVLDLTPALREAEQQAQTYHLRAVHWNRHGNAAAAEALAPWLAEQLAQLPAR